MTGARISLAKPTRDVVSTFLAVQRELEFTYPSVGGTREQPPTGYVVDRVSANVGKGEADFNVAREGLTYWNHFNLGWIEAVEPLAPIRPGEVAAVAARSCGLWWLNAARIVYVVDEDSPAARRFGFAYGTLPGHAESGEELFLVEWDRATDVVTYSIVAFSRPRHWLARLGRPLVRRMQRRFQRESTAMMVRAVANDCNDARRGQSLPLPLPSREGD